MRVNNLWDSFSILTLFCWILIVNLGKSPAKSHSDQNDEQGALIRTLVKQDRQIFGRYAIIEFILTNLCKS